MVIISDQIARSTVNFQVGYKVRHPVIQAGTREFLQRLRE